MELFERAGKIHIDLTDSPTKISSHLQKSSIYLSSRTRTWARGYTINRL